jgi:hypothetical protein
MSPWKEIKAVAHFPSISMLKFISNKKKILKFTDGSQGRI